MSKVAIVYWSGTGNTEAMAQEVKVGAEEKGAEVEVFEAAEFSADKVAEYDKIAFGCPAMGDEELEDTEFEPMFAECEPVLKDKPIVLFGSYEWADGEWMNLWEERCQSSGLHVLDTCIAYDNPDEEAKEACRKLGEQLA